MKKLTFITRLFAALALLLQFSSCEDLPAPEPITGDLARPTDQVVAGAPVLAAEGGGPVLTPGKDQARYAPAIIANADGTLSFWFTSEGGDYGEPRREVNITNTSGGPHAIHSAGNSGAIKNVFKESFFAWGVHCPAWGSADKPYTNSSMRWALYEWNTDYATTIAGTPIAEKEFINYKDNDWLWIDADDGYTQETGNKKFPEGTYLLYMEHISGTPGFWGGIIEAEGCVAYTNGSQIATTGGEGHRSKYQFARPVELSYTGRVTYNVASAASPKMTWDKDSLVLSPVEGELDQVSAKDPSVIKVGGYYYMAYTGTFEKGGNGANKVFAARCDKPDGIWEKWNGTGWGGKPAPVIDYTGDVEAFGAGQPSLVVKDNQIYLFYTYGDAEDMANTNLAVAPADENWPASLDQKGQVIDRGEASLELKNMDGASVKYIDELNCFQAIHAANREAINSCIVVWESTDGLSWTFKQKIYDNSRIFLTSPRYVADEQGHVKNDMHFSSYNFGQCTTKYKTWFSPVEFAK